MALTRRQLAPLALQAVAMLSARRALAGAPPRQVPAEGRIERWDAFASRHVDARPVEVWLPPGYDPVRRRYAVVYMHDGQMLFDARTTWNQQAWQVDVAASRLMAEGRVRDFIVVGPWNNGAWRHSEYFPAGFLPHLPEAVRTALVDKALRGRPQADAYLRFLVDELKPAVDARYATLPQREATFLMGSSMGGLISLYGLCEHPAVFGGAACLSTHWIGTYERNDAIPNAALAYLTDHLPPADRVRLYMDRGTTELDALYDQAQPRVDAFLAARGFAPPAFVSRVFEGAGHNERAWSERLALPFAHLLGPAAA